MKSQRRKRKKQKENEDIPGPKLDKINNPKRKKRSKKEKKAIKEAKERLKKPEKEYFQIGAVHERKQKTVRSNSPNVKTKTTATMTRWKGWKRREKPSEVVSYNLKDIQNNEGIKNKVYIIRRINLNIGNYAIM
ncbi:hypothetical protein AAHB62_29255 [Bacillus cereus]